MPHPVAPLPWFERDELDYQEFSANGVRTFAIVEGRAEGIPVVLLHGIPGAAFVWRPLLLSLTRKQRAIAYDLPEWGRSRPMFTSPTRMGWLDYAAWLKNALDAQGVLQCDVVAHGLGASIAMEFWLANPARVRRAVWIQPHFLQEHSRESFGAWLAARLTSPRWTDADVKRLLSASTGTGTGVLEASRSFYRELLIADLRMPNKRDVRRVEREFATRSAHYRAGLHARAGRTIVIWGEQAGFLHADAPDMIVKRLDCGALPMLERPGEVQELIREFLFD